MSSFFAYVINGKNVNKVFTDNAGIADILSKGEGNQSAVVLRYLTHQTAHLVGGEIVWTDIPEKYESQA